MSHKHKGSKFIVDVKSTGLYVEDKILLENNCKTIYWKTGHSHIKKKVSTEKALAGFEKSGHFFFNQPLGYGYDDGINSAIQVLKAPNIAIQSLLRVSLQTMLAAFLAVSAQVRTYSFQLLSNQLRASGSMSKVLTSKAKNRGYYRQPAAMTPASVSGQPR